MIEIPVELGERRYTIAIGYGLARVLPDLLGSEHRSRRIALVSGRRIFALHGHRVARALGALGTVRPVLIPDGERFKNRKTLDAVYESFLAAGLATAWWSRSGAASWGTWPASPPPPTCAESTG